MGIMGSLSLVVNGYFATSVSSAGDINNDGIDDLVVSAHLADPDGKTNAGKTFVIYGQSEGFSASLDVSTLDGSNGFVINGAEASESSGISVSGVGDVNNDGVDDLVIGAYLSDANGTFDAGKSYVVFGNDGGLGSSFDLSTLDGSNGFSISGIGPRDQSGQFVSGAGDINGDGINDIIIGMRNSYFQVYGNEPGESYVVFGQSEGFSANLNLSELDGNNGFLIRGVDPGDSSGEIVSGAGDVKCRGCQ